MDEMFEEEIYHNELSQEHEEIENSTKTTICPTAIIEQIEEAESPGVAESTQLQSNNEKEENAVTHSALKETTVSVLLKSEIQHVIKDKISNQNKICELDREAALSNRITEEYDKRIEHLRNIQADVQRKLYEKTYRSTEIEMYINTTSKMLNILREHQDRTDTRQQKLLDHINKLHHAHTEKDLHFIKATELLNNKKFHHKEKMKTLITQRDMKFKQISEKVDQRKERIKFLQDCANQLNEISQLQEKFNENNLRNNKQKEEIDAKTCMLKMKQNNLKSLREKISHLEESKKNMNLVHEENLNELNNKLNIARVK